MLTAEQTAAAYITINENDTRSTFYISAWPLNLDLLVCKPKMEIMYIIKPSLQIGGFYLL